MPGLFPETWTQTNKLAGEEGLSLCEARVCAGVKNSCSEGLALTCECNGDCSKGNSNFGILGFARALSNRKNALSSKRENDVIFSVYLPQTKSRASDCLRSIPDLYLLEVVLTEFCKAAK